MQSTNLAKPDAVSLPTGQGRQTLIFKYQRLASSSHFRYLSLRPLNGESFECDLHHELLKDSPSFAAIFYCWGNLQASHEILIDGEKFSVTDNLYCALQQLRRPFEVRYLWIDALCIDQKNDNKKTHQIGLMRSIFQQASRVLVWLGPAADNSDIAMEFHLKQRRWKSPFQKQT